MEAVSKGDAYLADAKRHLHVGEVSAARRACSLAMLSFADFKKPFTACVGSCIRVRKRGIGVRDGPSLDGLAGWVKGVRADGSLHVAFDRSSLSERYGIGKPYTGMTEHFLQ